MTPLEKLEALRDAYKKELPGKLSKIQSLFDKHADKGFDTESLTLFHRLIHNLIGSGATFGMMQVSEAARVLDDLLKPFIVDDGVPSKKETEAFKVALDSLVKVFEIQTDDTSQSISVDLSQKSLKQF